MIVYVHFVMVPFDEADMHLALASCTVVAQYDLVHWSHGCEPYREQLVGKVIGNDEAGNELSHEDHKVQWGKLHDLWGD